MLPSEFQRRARTFDSLNFDDFKARLSDPKSLKLLHAALGLTTEAGEFADVIKAYIYYGRPIDEVNLVEECSDLMWSIAQACHYLNVDLETVMRKNIEKLTARYGHKFSEEKANNRNTENERKVLEK